MTTIEKSNLLAAGGVIPCYKNAFTRELRPLLIRASTPISRAPSNNFPSPRVGMTESTAKNFDLLPHFNEDYKGRRLDNEDYGKILDESVVEQRKRRRKANNSQSEPVVNDSSVSKVSEKP